MFSAFFFCLVVGLFFVLLGVFFFFFFSKGCVCLIKFHFLSALFALLENGPNLIYGNELEISMEVL